MREIKYIKNTRYETKAAIDLTLPFSSGGNSSNLNGSSVPIIEILEIKKYENAKNNKNLNDNIVLQLILNDV